MARQTIDGVNHNVRPYILCKVLFLEALVAYPVPSKEIIR